MLNYKICKQLKDAGFPQIFSTQKIPMFYVDKVLGHATLNFNGMELSGTNVYCPSLQELIEACGQIVLWSYDDKWYAGKYNEDCCSDCYFDDYPTPLEDGDTPEEAVAKLLLEINE